MMYQVILNTVHDVIFEGSKSECEMVMEVFTKYNGCKNISMNEIK